MARFVTCGFEAQLVAPNAEGYAETYTGAPQIVTGAPRSGAANLSCQSGAARYVEFYGSGSTGIPFFVRTALKRSGTTSAQIKVIRLINGNTVEIASVRWETDNTLKCYDAAGNVIGSALATIANTWYVVEMQVVVPVSGGTSNGQIEWRVDAEVQGTSTTANTGIVGVTAQRFGKDVDGGISVGVDDIAFNDSVGTDNGYPGLGHVALLKPVSDGTRVGWTGGAGATTNLFDAVNNTPPIGVAVGASSTDLTQIEDATNNSTDAFTAIVASPTTAVASGGAGMKSGDMISGAYGIARGGNSTTTSRSMAVAVPLLIAETTAPTDTTAASTEPTGWATVVNPYTHVASTPAAFVSSVKIRKGTASANTMTYDLMGLMIEWNDSGGIVFAPRTARNTLLRR